ncbi:putative Biosynthetic Aromatic amino acid aminotransferase beta [Streptomyces misionensis JCM 4497]
MAPPTRPEGCATCLLVHRTDVLSKGVDHHGQQRKTSRDAQPGRARGSRGAHRTGQHRARLGRDARPRARQALVDRDADPARRRALRREHLLRPLLRHVPEGRQHGRHEVHRVEEDPEGHRHPRARGAAEEQPEPVRAEAAVPVPGDDLRPEPLLRPGAVRLQRRQGRPVRAEHRGRQVQRRPVRRAGPGDGLLRRQHRHRAVELRPAVHAERPRLQLQLRPVHARRAQPGLRQHARRGLRRPGHRQADLEAGLVHGPVAGQERCRHRRQRPGPGLGRLLRQGPHQLQRAGVDAGQEHR